MRRSLAAFLLIAVLLPALALAADPPPQRESFLWGIVQDLAQRILGKNIVVEGLSGSLGNIRIAHAELRDAQGAWLTADDLAVSWSPLQLIRGVAHFEKLTAAHIVMLRNQVATPAKPGTPPSSGSSNLPVRVQIDAAHFDRIDIAQPVAGAALALSADAKANLIGLANFTAQVTAHDLGAGGTYTFDGTVGKDAVDAKLNVAEPAGGAIATLASLPSLGALRVQASADGPYSGLKADVAVAAGQLAATANGTIDLTGQSADLDVVANAPAMAPGPGLSWQSVAVNAHVRGKFTTPNVTGTAHIAQFAAGGAHVQDFAADITGDRGQAVLHATIAGLQIPGPKPDIFAAAPVLLVANAQLSAPDRPVTFSLTHPLLTLNGSATTAGTIAAKATLAIPQLAPLASAGGVDLQGSAHLDLTGQIAGDTRQATVDGTLALTGGLAPAPALVGTNATIGATASMTGNDIRLTRLAFNGANAQLGATGSVVDNVVSLDWTAALSNLALAMPTLSGTLSGTGHVQGPEANFNATADVKGTLGTTGFAPGPVDLVVDAHGLPNLPTGTVTASGTVEGSPVRIAAAARRDPDGAFAVDISQASFLSASAHGALTLPKGATLPLGQVTLQVARLADFSAFAGQPLGGALDASADLQTDLATVELHARNAGAAGTGVRTADLTANIQHPLDKPIVQAQLAIAGLQAAGTAGSVNLTLNGPETALGLDLVTTLTDFRGAPLRANAAGTLDVPAENLDLATFTANWKGEAVRLLAPATVSLQGGLSVTETRIGLGSAVVTVAGKISPALDLTATARNVTPALARAFVPSVASATGTINADARITGTVTAPEGTVKMTAAGVRARSGMPAANAVATIDLAGATTRINARITAGRASVVAAGQVMPTLDLTATARDVSPALATAFSPQLANATGTISADARITGTPGHPDGTVHLTAAGVRVLNLPATNGTANVTLNGGTARVDARVTAGTAVVTVAGEAMPALDLTATARDVSPSLGAPFVPMLANARGTISADAHLTGTTARPEGTVRLTASGLRLPSGPAAGLPPANISADLALAGTVARVDTRVTAGSNTLTITGTAPISGTGALALQANGALDLALVNPVIEAQGERVIGRLTLAAEIGGTLAAPSVSGNATLAGGDVEDFSAGIHLANIEATLDGSGDTVTLSRFSAKAGNGTISGSGMIGLAGTMPIDIRVAAHNATPIASPLITARLDSALTVTGALKTGLALGGNIDIDEADITVPQKLPVSVATLDVRRPGQAPPPPAQPALDIALNLTVNAPARVFVRGRGIDAELEGKLTIGGTSAAPKPSGSFTLRRGTFSIAGTSITFTTGEVFFDGSGRIDPRLNFVASTTTANGTTANITVTGYASAPQIALTSSPQLPQDEILAQVLFGQSAASLSPFQLAEIAAAVAELSGVTGSGDLDVLGGVRKDLGLDQLSVGSSAGGGASLQAGRYIGQGVYLGVTQGTTGGPEPQVQINLTKRLKLTAGISAGGATTATGANSSDTGTSVGLTYQFQY